MNILFQACGLLVIVMLFIIYKTQKSLHLYRDQIFTVVMINAIIVLMADALSVIAIYFRDSLPDVLVKISCKTYLSAMTCFGFSAFFYVLVDAIDEKKRIKLLRIGFFIIALQVAAVFATPIEIVSENGMIYTKWISVYLCYAFTIIYILLTIYIALAKLLKKNKRRAIAVLCWMLIEIVAAVIQLIKPDMLVVAFAGALGILILYVTIQTPESNLDKQYNCFNSYSFDIFVKDRKDYNKKFSLLEIKITDKKLLNEKFFDSLKTPAHIISWITKNSKVNIFKNVDYSLILTSDNVNDLKELASKFQAFTKPYKVENQLTFTIVENSDWFENSVDLRSLIEYTNNKQKETQLPFLEISEEILKGYKEEVLIEEQVRKALLDNRVCVFFQPIYSFKTKKFDTAEALVRIIGDDGNIMMPGKFIPICEKTGLILELGKRVFERVCKFVSSNDMEKLGIHYIHVNLSVVQCENIELTKEIISIMEGYNIDNKFINFEITETGSIKAKNKVLDNMNELLSKGVKFALDDFGKGESNIGYLIDMPVSVLKLDMDITKAYNVNEKAKKTIQDIITLAHNIGITVVAEGIENQEELETFKKLGVDYIQGFVFSKPIPENDYLAFVAQRN